MVFRSVARVTTVVGVKRLVACALALAVVLPIAPSSAGAASSDPQARQREIAAERAKLAEEITEAAAKEAQILAELRVSQRKRAELDAQLASLDGQIAAAEAELGAVSATLEAAAARELEASRRVDRAKARLAEAQAVLRAQAVRAYISGHDLVPALDTMILGIDDVDDAPRVAAYVDAIARRQAAVVERHRTTQRDTQRLEAEAAAAKADTAAQRDAVVERRAALEVARGQQAAAQAAAAAEAAEEQRLLADVQREKSEYERRVAALQQESNSIAAELRRRQQGQTLTPSGRGVLGAPIAQPVVTSGYGYRTHPIYGDRRLHAGIDFRGSTGTPILSSGDGTVVFAGVRGGYGNTVIIDHGGQLATLYAHQSAMAVGEGQSVRRGQVIGAVGSTGNSTGPHLHFEVRAAGTPVDPMNYL
jgi:murein DD-endopeptidase MepM/ murein hydrolase activator NlpD